MLGVLELAQMPGADVAWLRNRDVTAGCAHDAEPSFRSHLRQVLRPGVASLPTVTKRLADSRAGSGMNR